MVINRKNVTKTAILIFIGVFSRHVIILLFSSFRNKHTNSLIKQAQYSASQQLQRWCVCFSFYLQWKLVVSWVQKRQMYSKSSQLPKEKLKAMKLCKILLGQRKYHFPICPEQGLRGCPMMNIAKQQPPRGRAFIAIGFAYPIQIESLAVWSASRSLRDQLMLNNRAEDGRNCLDTSKLLLVSFLATTWSLVFLGISIVSSTWIEPLQRRVLLSATRSIRGLWDEKGKKSLTFFW